MNIFPYSGTKLENLDLICRMVLVDEHNSALPYSHAEWAHSNLGHYQVYTIFNFFQKQVTYLLSFEGHSQILSHNAP